MKTSKYLIIFLIIVGAFNRCEEEQRGQIPLDSTPPQQITSISVENVPGGAIISYIIPEDDDLLYVKAIYTLNNGQKMEQKASAYSNKLEIVGIGKSRKQTVQIITGDRSKNESKPLEVEIHPLDSPIYDIMNSMLVRDDFGGISLLWNNPLGADIVISIDTLNQDNKYVSAGSIYTKSIKGKANVRGYPPVERVFAVSIRDRWNNTTDTVSGLYLPICEEQLDRRKFARWNPPGIPYQQYGSDWRIENIWDGRGSTEGIGYGWPLTAQMGESWTMDLGQLAKLSRFKIYQRATQEQLYTGANIKSFEFFGSPHRNVSDDESTWIYIDAYESFKPSGLPMGQISDEDYAYAVAGEEYSVDVSIPPVRYLRFKINKTWGGASYMQLMEIEFFGQLLTQDEIIK